MQPTTQRGLASFDPRGYWEARLRDHWGLEGVGYAALGKNYNRWLYRVRRKTFLRLAGSLGVNWREAGVLDVGSGTGFYLRLWNELGAREVSGSDLTGFAVSRLRQDFPGRQIHQFDAGGDLSIPGAGHYDAVSAFDVLFHITDDNRFERAIQNIYALLADGGWFLFSDNFLHSATQRSVHQVHRNLDEVTGALRRAGFQIITRRPMFVLMNQPVDTRSAGMRFLWRLATEPVRRSEWAGFLAGALTYPAELGLTRLLKESPTTEVMVCRRPSKAP